VRGLVCVGGDGFVFGGLNLLLLLVRFLVEYIKWHECIGLMPKSENPGRYKQSQRPKQYEQECFSGHRHCNQLAVPIHTNEFRSVVQHLSFPRKAYVPSRPNEYFSVRHHGQRKLLMSEIGALLLLDPGTEYTAVYAGAAPGIHTPLLSELFPNVRFHLYDPAPFRIGESDRIKLYNTYFTDSHALLYTFTSNLVFICDIRRTKDETCVWEDMQAQMRWHEIMRPMLTSLKFRLPWPGMGVADADNQVEYLDGDIHLPIWGPRNTTESRLVIEKVKHSGTRMYNCLVYEEEMCHFNRVMRPSIHSGQKSRDDGLDGCYDCAAETRLLELYAERYGVGRISTGRINRELGRNLV